MQYNRSISKENVHARLKQIDNDMDQTAYLFSLFKDKQVKIAINKLRYLLIVTKHKLNQAEDW